MRSMRPFVILLLLVAASCLSTYPYTFTATATSIYQVPSYPLGYISKDAKVEIILTLPFGGSASALTLNIMDSTNTNSVTSLSCSASPCSNIWTATDAGNYYLKASASGAFSQIITYYLVGIVNGQVSLKVVDAIRSKVIKYFYIAQEQSVTLTLSPVADSTTSYITLYSMGTAATNNPSVASTVSLGSPSLSSTISTYKATLTRGFYAAEVTMVVTASAKVSVQSDNYLCPYSSAYADVYRVFTGCSGEPTNPSPTGPPCAAYDYDALVCQACISGYVLVGGNCFTTSTCGSRQYSNFGNCYDVSPSCDKFDAFTGACVTCVNPDQFSVVNGSCIAKSAICKEGYNAVNGVCVSSTCGTFNPSTGACFTCINTAYYLTSGQCLPVYCGEGMYYSANASKCLNSPAWCLNFSLTYQVCYACSNGTVLSQGVCIQPPNSVNCLIYNLTSSACSTCNRGYYLMNNGCAPNPVCGAGEIAVNGRCTATQSSCTKNQVFINNQCIYLPDNCEAINNFYQCIRCAPRYQMVSGVCRYCVGSNANFPCITCGDGMFVNSKGLCQPIYPYCASYSTETGRCFSCINGQASVNGNCCDFGYVFQNESCVKPGNTGGSGGSISLQSKYGKYCKTINPEKQICTSCLDGHDFDETGRCS